MKYRRMSLPRRVLQLVLSVVCLLSLPFAWGWLLGDHSPPGADSQGMASFGLSHAIETTIGRTAVALWAITSLLLIAELVRRKLYVRWLALRWPPHRGPDHHFHMGCRLGDCGRRPLGDRSRTQLPKAPEQLTDAGSMKARSVDELLGVTVECPALQKFQVEVVRPAEDRVGTSGAGDDGEDRYLHAVDQARAHQCPVHREAAVRSQRNLGLRLQAGDDLDCVTAR